MSDILPIDTRDGVRTLTLNRPERRNALSQELQSALIHALRAAEKDNEVRVIVLTGSGEKIFCSGGDLSQMGAQEGYLAVHDARFGFAELLENIERCSKPTICRLAGHVFAGGVGLVAACDLVVAADDITISTPEIERGLFPMMISALLTRNLGRKKAFELMLLGEKWTARQAQEAGLINHAVPRAELDGKVQQMAQRLASMSGAVLSLGKRALVESREMDVREALVFLHSQLSINLMTEDAMEGVAAFLEKRPPQWKHR